MRLPFQQVDVFSYLLPPADPCFVWLAGGGRPRGEEIVQQCGIGRVRIRRDNSRLALPDHAAIGHLDIGVVGAWDPAVDGTEAQFEVRGMVGTPPSEDPATGSLNAGLALWLMESGVAPDDYVAAQGAALGRRGRVHVDRVGGATWVGGEVRTIIEGSVAL